MKEKLKSRFTIKNILISCLLSFEITLLLDVFCTFSLGLTVRIFYFPLVLILLFFILFFLPFHRFRIRIIISVILPLSMLLCAVLPYAVYQSFRNESAYKDIPCNSVDFFSNKTVMIIVPHEDDDLNLTSGMIENYIDCGSEIHPVFVTNGDYFGLGEERIREAIKCWDYIGVPESNVHFLGYGDGWSSESVHIYNAKEDEPLTSYIGNKETYGISTHQAYHNGNLYTNGNYRNDLKELILEIKPDIIFASDYDAHSDHVGVSLVSEQVMGEILKEIRNYQPIFYKGYAYSTAWKAPEDFYALNALSSKEPSDFIIYNWQDRVRFPVSTRSLSRSVFTSSVYNELSIYESQNANSHATRIVNSDKVFWQRRTDSLLHKAEIRASSGTESLLSDFRILDNNDINDLGQIPTDGVWIPDDDDSEKSVTITLDNSSYISQIVIYDNPSLEDNIDNIRITLDDDSVIETGELNKDGKATVVKIDKEGIKQFKLEILAAEGSLYGISEIEAFESTMQETDTFIKLMDDEANFVYDYITEGDEVLLSLYSNSQESSSLTEENYTILCDNDKCSFEVIDNMIHVKCLRNESGMITVTERSTGLSDTVRISNPNLFVRTGLSLGQKIEDQFVFPIDKDGHRAEQDVYNNICHNLTIYRFLAYFKAKIL